MRKVEYVVNPETLDNKHSTLDSEKHDDPGLPEFAKEVPISSKKTQNKDTISIDYGWKQSVSHLIRVKKITFAKGESLSDFYRLNFEDGVDSICVQHNNSIYILRKTTKEIAQALCNVYGRIKGLVENIVGYLRTMLGNDYVISKVEKNSWAFDNRISNEDVKYLNTEILNRTSRSNLCEYIIQKLADLHALNLILGRFNINHVLLTHEDLLFTDLRKMRESRKRSFVVDEFKTVLQYLFNTGIATRDDVYFSIAYYVNKNPSNCDEWYRDKTNKKPKESFDVAIKIEEEVYA